MAYGATEVPVMAELDSAPSQSDRSDENDAIVIEGHEITEACNTEDEIASTTSPRQDSANAVETEARSFKPHNQPLNPELMIKQPDTRPISAEQLVAEVKGIYAGLVMIEGKCIEVDDAQMPPTNGLLDVTRYLLMIPDAKLRLLQEGGMNPDNAVRAWFNNVHVPEKNGSRAG